MNIFPQDHNDLPFDPRHYSAVRDSGLSREHFPSPRSPLKPLIVAMVVLAVVAIAVWWV